MPWWSLGMGLSISQKIVEAQGGALWGAANREGGATFAFTLPRRAKNLGFSTSGSSRPPRTLG